MENPVTVLQPQFSSDGAAATAWVEARECIEKAEVFWLTTVRPDARPHVTPVLAVWLNDTAYFLTSASERKAKNLAHNAQCALTTGYNTLSEGLDLVIEGEAVTVSDNAVLRAVADRYEAKYGRHFTAPDGNFFGLGDAIRSGNALVYAVAPTTAFGFGKGEQFSQTRWRFSRQTAAGNPHP